MITKEEYIKALEVVDAYHRQLKEQIADAKISLAPFKVERGDLLTYIGGSESQYLIKGEKYVATGENFINGREHDVVPVKNSAGQRVVMRTRYFKKD